MPPSDESGAAPADPGGAETASPSIEPRPIEPRRGPRLGPTFAALIATPAAATALSILALTAGWGLDTGFEGSPQDWMEGRPPLVVLHLLILPVQALLLAVPLVLAWRSPQPWKPRLSLRRPHPLPLAFLLLAGTAVPGMFGGLMAEALFDGESEHLRWLSGLITEPRGGAAVYIVLCMSALPALAEELFFRGYVQTRLLERWNPGVAIVVTGLAFALFHMDPMHSLAVFPIGLYLGFVAWATGSVWTAVACHFLNNLVSLALVRVGADLPPVALGAWVIFSLVSFLLAVSGALRWRRALRGAPAHS